ncbi:MAG: hypothetical protein IT539_13965 [Bradyrhizobiaceae bacterium]|nr:hypothetical protein [Bradyrhizobiaceae bacterium]
MSAVTVFTPATPGFSPIPETHEQDELHAFDWYLFAHEGKTVQAAPVSNRSNDGGGFIGKPVDRARIAIAVPSRTSALSARIEIRATISVYFWSSFSRAPPSAGT